MPARAQIYWKSANKVRVFPQRGKPEELTVQERSRLAAQNAAVEAGILTQEAAAEAEHTGCAPNC